MKTQLEKPKCRWGKGERRLLICIYNRILLGIISERRWMGNVALTAENGHAYKVSIVNPEGNRRLGKSRRRWETNVKMCHIDV